MLTMRNHRNGGLSFLFSLVCMIFLCAVPFLPRQDFLSPLFPSESLGSDELFEVSMMDSIFSLFASFPTPSILLSSASFFMPLMLVLSLSPLSLNLVILESSILTNKINRNIPVTIPHTFIFHRTLLTTVLYVVDRRFLPH
ncbi:hypothetical protein BDZ97DRAFT_1039597 [Flammula alnicola]|nr:hypothetical protein BDZ97DRAFT_1039597 [Flammula alnicola]